jgi:hypothetical protein
MRLRSQLQWIYQVYSDHYKRDRLTQAIVATNKEDINNHRLNICQRNKLKNILQNQENELYSLRHELEEVKKILSHLISK